MSATALYRALLEAKVSEETAEKAVEGLVSANEAATKTEIAELRASANEAATKTEVVELRAFVDKTATQTDEAATKADLAELRAATKADLAELRAATKADLKATKVDLEAGLAELRTGLRAVTDRMATKDDLAALEIKMIKWGITFAGLIIAAVGLMFKFL